MMTTLKFVLFWFGLAAFAAEASDKWDITKLDVSKLPPAAKKTGLTYANDVRPLLETSCLRCHGEDRPKADLRLDSLESVLKGGKDGKVVIPGNSKSSLLIAAAAQVNDEVAMPPKRGPGGPGGFGGPGGRGFGGPPGAGGGNGPSANGPGGTAPRGPNGSGPGNGGPGPGFGGPGGGSQGGFRGGPPAKALTVDQVSLIRAWIDQGAK